MASVVNLDSSGETSNQSHTIKCLLNPKPPPAQSYVTFGNGLANAKIHLNTGAIG